MDGKGAWRDNVFVECIWKSVKYEGVYLRLCQRVRRARLDQPISRPLQRPQTSPEPGRQTPNQAYFNALQQSPVAA